MHVRRLLLELLKPQRKRVALLLLAVVAAALVPVALIPGLAYTLVNILDEHAQPLSLPPPAAHFALLQHAVSWVNEVLARPLSGRLHLLYLWAAVALLVALFRGIVTYFRIYLGQYVGGRVLVQLRSLLFERLQRQSIAFHDSQRVGDLMSRLMNDVALVQQLFREDMTNYLLAPLIVLGGIGMMVRYNWRLTLMVMVFAPLMAWVIQRTGRRIRRLTVSQQERIADLNARLHERLASIRVIQSFAREEYEVARFRELNENTFSAMIRVARVAALSPQAVQFLGYTSFVMLGTYAGLLILRQELRLSVLIALIVLLQQVGAWFVKFGTLHLRVQQALGALGRIVEVIAREPDIVERPEARPLPPVEGRIAFRHVTFRYAEGEPVLHDINLEIAPGETVAVVGPSGAGKTSLANLVLRFYDPTEGRVEIDGHDLREVTLHSLRQQIGLVPQETILFGGTIKENIRYGRADASDEEVVEAAKAANAHEFITALPEGYETDVGERAVKLSGGQRQRIAVARALLKDPRILILDEATSSLDVESEAAVQKALEVLMQGRTTLVIAHRLSTVRRADRILVLSDGRIVEEGTHEQLLAAGGVYSRLYRMQMSSGLDELPPPEPGG